MENQKGSVPRKEDPKLRKDLLARIVASYISGIHHEDVVPDEIDFVIGGKVLNYIDRVFDEMTNSSEDL